MNAATYNAWFNQVIIPGTAVQASQTPLNPLNRKRVTDDQMYRS